MPATHYPAAETVTALAKAAATHTMNRKRYTTARASAARIASAALWAGALTIAAVAWTACAAAYARWTDDATAAAVAALIHNAPCTLGDIHHAPADLQTRVWRKWTTRAVTAPRRSAQETAASARVLDFATGRADTVDERDLMDASPSAIRAAVDSGRLD